MSSTAKAKNTPRAKKKVSPQSPLGEAASQGARRRRQRSAEYAAEADRLAPYEALARLVIKYRLEHNLTQEELAEKISTSHSAISRLESGRATITFNTMKRIAEALGTRLLVGFESESDERQPAHELVAL
jgi:ribosome-binding protein aMBF1 (putative translation factor)